MEILAKSRNFGENTKLFAKTRKFWRKIEILVKNRNFGEHRNCGKILNFESEKC